MFSLLMRISLLVMLVLIGVDAQTTEVTCTNRNLTFSVNSLKQSPCLVSAYLANPCSITGDFDVPYIGPGYYYTPPDETNQCLCSTVTYSLTNACAACQGAEISTWSLWSENCTFPNTSPDGEYPLTIPLGTAVPAWAYQLVFETNKFNLSLARMVGDSPERTPPFSYSSSIQSTQPSSSATQPSSSATQPSSSATQPSSSSSANLPSQSTNGTSSNLGNGGRSNHTGAIVGGVVGGVAGIALIGGLFAFLIRSNRRSGHYQYQQHKPTESPGTVAYSYNNAGGDPNNRPTSNYSMAAGPNSGMSITSPSSPVSGAGPAVPLNAGWQGSQMGYPSGHQLQPSLQGTSISERPHDPNVKLGSASESDRLAVY